MSTHTATVAAAHSEYLRHRVRFAPAAASQLLADFFREDRTVHMPRDPQVWMALVEHGDSNTLARAVLTCLQPGELQLVGLDAGLRFDCLDAMERHAWALVAADRAPVLPPDGFPALLAEKVFEPLGLFAEAAALYALGHDDRDASGKPLDRLTRAVMRYRLARSLGRLAQDEPEWRSGALELMASACRACEPKSPERLGSDPTGLRLRLHGYQWLGARWAADGREADARQAFERAIRAAMELGEGELAVALEAFSRYSLGPANDGVPVPTLPSSNRRPSSGSRSPR